MDKVKKLINDIKTPLLSIFFSFLVGATLIIFSGKNPVEAYAALFRGAFGSPAALSQTLNKSISLILQV